MTRSLRATPAAEAQIEECAQWWRENREKNPDLFDDELEDRLKAILSLEIGYLPAVSKGEQTFHRMLMKKTRYWLYFTIDDDEWITVHACWHTSRRGTPPLGE